MGRGVDLLEFADTDLGVDLGGVEPGVAELLLDEAGVGPVLQHEGGAGVAQQVAGAGFAQIGRFDVIAHQLGEPIGGKGLEEVGQKQRAAVRFSDQIGTHLPPVFLDPLDGAIADGSHAILASLALPDHDRAALFVLFSALRGYH